MRRTLRFLFEAKVQADDLFMLQYRYLYSG